MRLPLAVQNVTSGGQAARSNLRLHLARAFARVALLIPLDLAAVLASREILRGARAGMFGAGPGQMISVLYPPSAISALPLAGAVVIGMFATGAYRAGDRWKDPTRALTACLVGVFVSSYGELWQGDPLVTLARGAVIWLLLGLLVVAERFAVSTLELRLPRRRLKHRVLLIGGSGASPALVGLGPTSQAVGVIKVDELPEDIEGMEHWLRGGVDTLLVSADVPPEHFGRLTDFALTHGCRLLCAPRASELDGLDAKRVWLGGNPYSELTSPSLRASQLFVKRVVDIFGGGLLLCVFAPLLAILALAVKLDSPGPVFFRQRRAAYRGGFFELLKLRSMRADAETVLRADPEMYARYLENDFKLPENEDPRITPLGRTLRKTSLDELPQLINVVRGDMSLVGPRPVVEPELEMYRGRIPTFLSMKPGITGPWQISGRSNIGFPERAQMDLDYVRNWSLLRDGWILLLTLPAVVLRRGAH